MKLLPYFLIALILYLPLISQADTFEKQATYTVCFTPPENCTKKIIHAINHAVSNVWVQAYSFTSHPIGNALVNAKERGVNVQIILDKSHLNRSDTANFFMRHNIPVWIDKRPAIAHNKVMIIDQVKVITGSFNFTNAAQYKNAENVLIISDVNLAKRYLQNWQQRQILAEPFTTSVKKTETNDWLDNFWLWLEWVNKWLVHSLSKANSF